MSRPSFQPQFDVHLIVLAAGPIRRRTRLEKYELLRAELDFVLPFVPFPGLYLRFTKPKTRGTELTLYLRLRTVEWVINDHRFECVADEMLGSLVFAETYEVRGSPRISKHFVELQKTLREFGFEIEVDVDEMTALHKSADGTII